MWGFYDRWFSAAASYIVQSDLHCLYVHHLQRSSSEKDLLILADSRLQRSIQERAESWRDTLACGVQLTWGWSMLEV